MKTTTKRTCKGVDEQNLNVVAQEKVTTTNKGKATFRLPTVRLTVLLLLGFVALFTTCDTPRQAPRSGVDK